MIRIALLFLSGILCTTCCLAQDLIKHTKKITHEVTEKYTAYVATDREIKQGIYQAFYNKKTLIAFGKYTNDKRTGTWHFFSNWGQPIQNYDYDTNTLKMEAREDASEHFMYSFDHEVKPEDVVTKPIKPGGRYYGYLPYLKCFTLPKDMAGENLDMYSATLEILVSPMGRLAEYKIHIKAKWDKEYDRVINVNINRLLDEDKIFVPATLNGKPIAAQILIGCYFTPYQTIDIK